MKKIKLLNQIMSLYKWIVIFIFQIDNKILKLESFLAILDKNNLSQKHSHTKYQFEREINTSNHYLLEDCLINEIYIRPDEIDKIIYVFGRRMGWSLWCTST